MATETTLPQPANTISQGRSYAHAHDGAYALPNDAPELARLEEQAANLSAIMGGRIVHAPIVKPRKILDVGCGTGIVTYTMAEEYPGAQVYGLDLSRVPSMPGKMVPGNVRFVQGDIRTIKDTIGTEDPDKKQIADGNFDLVFSRLLVAGMTDWPGHIRRVASLLAPGYGYIEVHDLDSRYHRKSDGSLVGWDWERAYEAAHTKRGKDVAPGPRAAEWMRQAGLVDIEVNHYRFPLGPQDEQTEAYRTFGTHQLTASPALWESYFPRTLEGQLSSGQLEAYMDQMRRSLVVKSNVYYPFIVTRGRRPA